MLQPFLFIGVGGSGGDTLRHLYRELKDRLRTSEITKMPTGWQFLHIDTPSTAEYAEDLPELAGGSYLGLTHPGVNYQVIASQLDDRSPAAKAAFLGWRPDPRGVHVAVEEGAGQYRAIGRSIAVSRLDELKDRIYQKIDRVWGANLGEVTSALTGSATVGQRPNPAVVVFSSLAGGTGSGIFLDVCDILRGSQHNWAADSVAVLFAPDVFDSLNDNMRRGVQANALAVISELLALRWVSDPTQDALHSDAGVLFRGDGRAGPGYSFLVGAENESGRLSFANQQEVFAAVARTMAAWATSQSIQKQFSSYVASNWQQMAQLPDPLRLSEKPLDMPFSALGYASVGLGRKLFHRYAAQCLARVTVHRLLAGGVGGGRSETDTEELVRQRRVAFGRAALALPPRSDEITSGDETARSLPAALITDRAVSMENIKGTVRASLGSTPKLPEEWLGLLDALISEQVNRFLNARRLVLQAGAVAWVAKVQHNLRDEIGKALARDGLVVAQRLVANLIVNLGTEVGPALEQSAISDDATAGKYLPEMAKALGHSEPRRRFGRQRLLLAENEKVQQALARGVECALGFRFDAEVRRLAARLVADMVKGLLQPMSEELTRGLKQLTDDARPTAGRSSTVDLWPMGPAFVVPAGLRPSRTEFLIDSVEDYPSVFKEKMAKSVQGANLLDDSVGMAIPAILTGDWVSTAGHVELVEQTATWRPRTITEWSDVVEQEGAFHSRLTAADLLARCRAWTEQAPGIGGYLKETLATALGDAQPTAEQTERMHRYEVAFVQALEASSPLVRMNPAYRTRYLAGGTAAYAPLISQIPLNPDTPAYDLTRDLLLRHSNIKEETLDSLFNPAGSGDIELTTFLNSPCHPIGFASLMEPIQKDWKARRVTQVQRAGFAQWRRARPLTRSVALPDEVRRRLIRSWLISYALDGKPEFVEDSSVSLQLRISDNDPTPAIFPLLGDVPNVDDPLDCLAAVLESFSLAFVDALDPSSTTVESFRRLLAVDINSITDAVHPAAQIAATFAGLAQRITTELPSTRRPAMHRRIVELHDDLRDVIVDLHHLTKGWVK